MKILSCKAIFELVLMLVDKFFDLVIDFSFAMIIFTFTLFVKCGTLFVNLV